MTTTTTTNTNGQVRKTLASQLDRLDAILDCLGDGLHQAVATAVEQAVEAACRARRVARVRALPAWWAPALTRFQARPSRPGLVEGGGGVAAAGWASAAWVATVARMAARTSGSLRISPRAPRTPWRTPSRTADSTACSTAVATA